VVVSGRKKKQATQGGGGVLIPFKNCRDVALRDVVSGYGGGGGCIGFRLGDLRGLFQPL